MGPGGQGQKERQRAFRVLRSHPEAFESLNSPVTNCGASVGTQATVPVTASGRTQPLALRPPASHPSCPLLQAFPSFTRVFPGAKPHGRGSLKQQ